MAQKERWNETKTKSFITSYLHKPALWDAGSSVYSQKSEVNRLNQNYFLQFKFLNVKFQILNDR